ncbi:MAG: SOS-response repressor and protease LexA [uncultured Chloroflexi bacterium]|uniref:LexA repressor n=1 Tax=uncultured Chloroflexota bacterium TaxID=166587 RepID=A0A6J4HKT3_9CHLR|nr:MAG: SOS-response repressor and protease LexA [uncultured Chloroflexota bacterium]
MEILSDRQRQILDFISRYIADHDRPPTNREIGHAMGIASTGHVDYHLTVLSKKGYIEREANTSRGLKLTTVAEPHPRRRVYHVPVVGLIAAGSPIEAISDPSDAVELGDDFAAEDAYALRVRGKSMIEDLIDDGDLVVVQPAQTAQNGEVVVALLNSGGSEHGEVTLKRYYRERDHIRLQPANQTMQPIIVRPEDVQVQGKVIALIRRI